MKLLSLNAWGARQGALFFDFLNKHKNTTDIFCFQEIFDSSAEVLEIDGARTHLFGELQKILPDFQPFFAETYQGWADGHKVDFHLAEGQAIFVRKGYQVKETGSVYIFGDKGTVIKKDFSNEPKQLQFAKFVSAGKEFLVANAHGLTFPGEKLDTPDRLEQSKKILQFLSACQGPKILCGDFNLMPDTESITMLEKGMKNLIKEFKIETTRNELSWNRYHNRQLFADYVFTSPKVEVKNFIVPNTLASDHLPMILEFEI